MRTVLVLATVAVLAGCTTADLRRPGPSQADVGVQRATLDDVECRRLAAELPGTPDAIVGGLADVVRVWLEESRRDAAYRRCMADRGYAPRRPPEMTALGS